MMYQVLEIFANTHMVLDKIGFLHYHYGCESMSVSYWLYIIILVLVFCNFLVTNNIYNVFFNN